MKSSKSQFVTFLITHFSQAVFSLSDLNCISVVWFLSHPLFPFLSRLLFPLLPVAHTISLTHTNRWWGTVLGSVTRYPLIQSCQLAARSSTARFGRGTAAIWEQWSWRWTFPPRHLVRKTSQEQSIFCLAEMNWWTPPAAVLLVVLKTQTTYQTLIYGWQNLQGALRVMLNACVVKNTVRLHLLILLPF